MEDRQEKTMQKKRIDTFSYALIRSKRRTMSMEVKEDGTLLVRAPLRAPEKIIEQFVEGHRDWILRQRRLRESAAAGRRTYTEEEKKQGRALAKRLFEEKCRYFGERMGVSYGRISIREQKTRWGSCSSRGNLNFNWKLALMPGEIQDYLAVHELAHRIEMNHGKRFWELVEKELPDYKRRREWLKRHGGEF